MSRRKRDQPAETSSITRTLETVAYSRTREPDRAQDRVIVKDDAAKDSKTVAKDVKDTKDAKDAKQVKDNKDVKDTKDAKADETDGTPEAVPNEPTQPNRGRVDTIGMPAELLIGLPPAMPTVTTSTAAPATTPATVEGPTHMPGPRDVPPGNPDDPAAPPGLVPAGDSRSLRRGSDFALIYRLGNAVISRFGTVGTRGQWRVVEYPTTASASHSYAKESSRFVSEGFSDYRE